MLGPARRFLTLYWAGMTAGSQPLLWVCQLPYISKSPRRRGRGRTFQTRAIFYSQADAFTEDLHGVSLASVRSSGERHTSAAPPHRRAYVRLTSSAEGAGGRSFRGSNARPVNVEGMIHQIKTQLGKETMKLPMNCVIMEAVRYSVGLSGASQTALC